MEEQKIMAVGGAVVLCLAVLLGGALLLGQQPPVPEPPPPAPGAPPSQPITPQQLEDLVAPIALYPDNLLSEILAASTYPLEIVEAQEWLDHNRNLTGQKLMEKAQHEKWDPSVQALVAFPDVLARLNSDIRWTTDLGNAFLAQQGDVMAAVQRLRARAEADGKLKSGPQETVTTATQNEQTAIQIQPVDPGVVYVPYYNPAWVWGPPVYGYYPPLLYPGIDVGFSYWPGVDLGFFFGGGWGLWGGFGWGWGPNWFGGGIILDPFFFHRFGFRDFHGGFGGGNVWAHDPAHRLGVAYPNRDLAQRFGGANFRGGAAFRGNADAFRGSNNFRGANETSRGNESARTPSERFGSQGFERQNPGGNRSAFGGAGDGNFTRMQSDHGFSSMGHAGGFGGGGFGGHAGGFGGGAGGGHGGGRR